MSKYAECHQSLAALTPSNSECHSNDLQQHFVIICIYFQNGELNEQKQNSNSIT